MKDVQSQEVIRCNSLQEECDHIFWNNQYPSENMRFQDGDIIFCKIDQVLRFFEKIRLTRKRIILVTGEGDFPCDVWRQQFLPANIACWFATNVTDPHPKVCAVPLGLGGLDDSVTLNAITDNESKRDALPAEPMLYVNFRSETNPEIRCNIYHYFESLAMGEPWITFEEPAIKGSNENYLKQLMRHHFVLAPPGNGVDTHRLWEALSVGVYPIALRSSVLEPFASLPILFVDDFREVTLGFLKENLAALEKKKNHLEMLQMNFWKDKLDDAKKQLLEQKKLSWSEWINESTHYGIGMMKQRIWKSHFLPESKKTVPCYDGILATNKIKDLCDHIFWSNEQPFANMQFHGGDIVFCKIDQVLRFFEKIRLTRKKIILVTGEGCIPCDEFRQQFLPENVVAWFSTNVTHLHPKISAIPLGLGKQDDLVTLMASDLLDVRKTDNVKEQWLYVNFRPETNPKIRRDTYDHFEALVEREPWITFEKPATKGSNKNYLRQLMRHHFVLAPPGNGVDTHRLWEAMLAGAYPIVLRAPAMEPFSAMPILFVDDFREVTLDFLKENIVTLEKKKNHLEMLQMSFWKQKIETAKNDLKNGEKLTWKEWFRASMQYALSMLQRRLS